YVNGDNYATFKWSFASTANYNNVKLLHGVDALPQGQDNGYGAHNVACNGLSISSPQVGPNFFYEFIPVTAPTAYRVVLYSACSAPTTPGRRTSPTPGWSRRAPRAARSAPTGPTPPRTAPPRSARPAPIPSR